MIYRVFNIQKITTHKIGTIKVWNDAVIIILILVSGGVHRRIHVSPFCPLDLASTWNKSSKGLLAWVVATIRHFPIKKSKTSQRFSTAPLWCSLFTKTWSLGWWQVRKWDFPIWKSRGIRWYFRLFFQRNLPSRCHIISKTVIFFSHNSDTWNVCIHCWAWHFNVFLGTSLETHVITDLYYLHISIIVKINQFYYSFFMCYKVCQIIPYIP